MSEHDVRQEDDRLRARPVIIVGVGVIVLTIALILVAAELTAWRGAIIRPSGNYPERRLGPPKERLGLEAYRFGSAHEDGPTLAAEQRAALDSWGWVDRAHQRIHVPIDVAIDLEVAEHERAEQR
jgi:hypothetical protein